MKPALFTSTTVVHEHDRVPELMDEREDVVHHQQHERLRRRVLAAELEPPAQVDGDERDESEDGDEAGGDGDRRPEEEA